MQEVFMPGSNEGSLVNSIQDVIVSYLAETFMPRVHILFLYMYITRGGMW